MCGGRMCECEDKMCVRAGCVRAGWIIWVIILTFYLHNVKCRGSMELEDGQNIRYKEPQVVACRCTKQVITPICEGYEG